MTEQREDVGFDPTMVHQVSDIAVHAPGVTGESALEVLRVGVDPSRKHWVDARQRAGEKIGVWWMMQELVGHRWAKL